MDRKLVFYDTQERIKSNRALTELTRNTVLNTKVIEENFHSEQQPYYEDSRVTFEENLTLITAYHFVDAGKKTGVLNFANPVEPGGGILRGVNAQEEYLCRASNLYNCLTSSQAKPYYDYHNILLRMNQFNSIFLSSDRIIYSPNVVFFKEDIGYFPDMECSPTQEYTDQWRTMDVITCAAPFFSSGKYILPNGDLYHLLCKRIRNIFETAMSHHIGALVLGAFGCGAFHNPPALVTKAFQDVLLEERYAHAFSDVVFAVKRTDWFCENIEAFDIAFKRFPPSGEYVFSTETNKRRFFE